MRLVTSCVRLACDVELLSNNRQLFSYHSVTDETGYPFDSGRPNL